MEETQGNKKIMQYLEDLIRNKNFIKDLKKCKNFLIKQGLLRADYKLERRISTIYEECLARNRIYCRQMKRANNDYISSRIIKKLSRKYSIDENIVITLAVNYLNNKNLLTFSDVPEPPILDMCKMIDDYDEHYYDQLSFLPIAMFENKKIYYESFPISIGINVMASKRDVMDFIEKNWFKIEDSMNIYRDKKKKFRKRKHTRELCDFIWDNRSLKMTELKNMLNEKFPENTLVYNEIQDIIRNERKRRFLK